MITGGVITVLIFFGFFCLVVYVTLDAIRVIKRQQKSDAQQRPARMQKPAVEHIQAPAKKSVEPFPMIEKLYIENGKSIEIGSIQSMKSHGSQDYWVQGYFSPRILVEYVSDGKTQFEVVNFDSDAERDRVFADITNRINFQKQLPSRIQSQKQIPDQKPTVAKNQMLDCVELKKAAIEPVNKEDRTFADIINRIQPQKQAPEQKLAVVSIPVEKAKKPRFFGSFESFLNSLPEWIMLPLFFVLWIVLVNAVVIGLVYFAFFIIAGFIWWETRKK